MRSGFRIKTMYVDFIVMEFYVFICINVFIIIIINV